MSNFWNAPAWSMGKRAPKSLKKQPLTTPGPCNYDSSLTISKHAPAWKQPTILHRIGSSLRDHTKGQLIPGPGQYNVQSTSMAPKISVATRNHRYADNHDNHMPGPGNYNVTYDGIVRNQTSYTMGVRCSSKEQEAQPGPGAYNAVLEPRRYGGRIGTAKRDQLAQSNKKSIPGPGKYNSDGFVSSGPKFGFGAQKKTTSGIIEIPGPGQYDIQTWEKPRGCTMGKRSQSTKIQNINSPGPGSYSFAERQPQSGTKIGKSARISLGENTSPGPGAYNLNYRPKSGCEIKMGSSQRQMFLRAQTPGPGSYELGHDAHRGITISGYKNKQVLELTPGPGSYEYLDDIKRRPCSAKIGKSLRTDPYGSNNTPGPGQYYYKQSKQYHFAHTNQLRSKEVKASQPGPGQYDVHVTVPCAPAYLLDPNIYKSYGH